MRTWMLVLLVLASSPWLPLSAAQVPPAIVIEVEPLPLIAGHNETVSTTVTTTVTCAHVSVVVPPRVEVSHGLSGEWPYGIDLVLDPPYQYVDLMACEEGRATVTTTLRARAQLWTTAGEIGKIAVVGVVRGASAETSEEATSEPIPIRVAQRVDVEVGVWDPPIEGLPNESYWLGYGGQDPETLMIEVFNRGNVPATIEFVRARTEPSVAVELPATPLIVPTGSLPAEERTTGYGTAQLRLTVPGVSVDAAGPERYAFVLEYLVLPPEDALPVTREMRLELLVGPLDPMGTADAPRRTVPSTGALMSLAMLAALVVALRRP